MTRAASFDKQQLNIFSSSSLELYKLNYTFIYRLNFPGKSQTPIMYLTDISNLPTFSVFRASKKPSAPGKFDSVSRSFDEALLRRIKALGAPSISLSWLSRALDFLSFTHAEAKSLISDLKSSSLDDDSLTRYLDDSVKILDLCNSVSSHVERLRQGGLLVNFFLHLVKSPETPPPEKLRRARDSLAAFQISNFGAKRLGFEASLEDLVRDLAGGAIRRKISSVGRLIYAVELVTVFVGVAVASALYGSPDLKPVRAPAEFSWSGSFNELQSAFSAELNRRFAAEENQSGASFEEWGDVEERLRAVCDVIDDVDDEGKRERLNGAVAELEKVREKLTEGLDGVVDGVNGTFQTVLCIRNGMLANFRLGQNEKRPAKAKRCA